MQTPYNLPPGVMPPSQNGVPYGYRSPMNMAQPPADPQNMDPNSLDYRTAMEKKRAFAKAFPAFGGYMMPGFNFGGSVGFNNLLRGAHDAQRVQRYLKPSKTASTTGFNDLIKSPSAPAAFSPSKFDLNSTY